MAVVGGDHLRICLERGRRPAKIVSMAERVEPRRRRAAVMASLLVQMRRSPELTKVLILLLVWGNVRARAGFTTLQEEPIRGGRRNKRGQRRKSFSLKRPRERFL